MKVHELARSQKKPRKRVGRGISSGSGKTAGRGTKGQNARSGGGVRPGFEGGQNPLMQRLPKQKGFHSRVRSTHAVYTRQIEAIRPKTIDTSVLSEIGLIPDKFCQVKLIDNGDITKAKTVKLFAVSQAAEHKLEKAGGSFVQTDPPKRSKKTK